MAMRSNRAAVSRELRREVDKRLTASALLITGNVQRLTPVDTGRLRASMQWLKDGMTVYIGTNVYYAKYVEFPTRHTAAQPFLVPGINVSRGELIAIWSEPIAA